MKLPVIMPELKTQRFACHSCTNCCRELVVHLTPADVRKIDAQNWAGRIDSVAYIRLGRNTVLNHRPNGGCVFLQEDGRCRIHVEHGGAAKPLACQLYPFTLHREGDDLLAAVRFDCPSVAASRGEPIPQHRQEVRRLAAELGEAGESLFPPVKAVELRRGCRITAAQTGLVVKKIDDWISDTDRPLNDRLHGLCSLCDTLDAARLDAVNDEQLGELVALLIVELKSTAPPVELPPPAERHLALLRMDVFAHGEYVGLADLQAPIWSRWRRRFSQLRRGRRMVRGHGDIPPLVENAPVIPFDRLDQVHRDPNGSPREDDELLTRYLRMRLLSHSAFGDGYYGWPVVDGLRAMILSIVAARWMARYLALVAERSIWQFSDLQKALGFIDRAAGRAKELGRASGRLRIHYFARDRGLARLLFHDLAREGPGVSDAAAAG